MYVHCPLSGIPTIRGSVRAVHLSAKYASVLCDGTLHLHTLVPGGDRERESRHFPDKDDSAQVITCQVCVCACETMVAVASMPQIAVHFPLKHNKPSLIEYRRHIFPDFAGTT